MESRFYFGREQKGQLLLVNNPKDSSPLTVVFARHAGQLLLNQKNNKIRESR